MFEVLAREFFSHAEPKYVVTWQSGHPTCIYHGLGLTDHPAFSSIGYILEYYS